MLYGGCSSRAHRCTLLITATHICQGREWVDRCLRFIWRSLGASEACKLSRPLYAQTSHTVSVLVYVCVCRYHRVGQGDGFISMWYSACWSALWAICLINSSSLHATGFSTHGLPLASGYTQHARLHICIFMCECCTPGNVLHQCMILHVWFKISIIVHQRNLAQHHSPVERRLKTAIYRITLLRKQSEESIKL